MFEGIRQWHPSGYNNLAHIGFLAMLAVPIVGLFVMQANLRTKRTFALLLTLGYIATGALAQQATSYILP